MLSIANTSSPRAPSTSSGIGGASVAFARANDGWVRGPPGCSCWPTTCGTSSCACWSRKARLRPSLPAGCQKALQVPVQGGWWQQLHDGSTRGCKWFATIAPQLKTRRSRRRLQPPTPFVDGLAPGRGAMGLQQRSPGENRGLRWLSVYESRQGITSTIPGRSWSGFFSFARLAVTILSHLFGD